MFQLVQIDWLITIRKTTLEHYILGEGYLWLDLIFYTRGTLSAYSIDFIEKLKLNKC
jgi:hypothetical protein